MRARCGWIISSQAASAGHTHCTTRSTWKPHGPCSAPCVHQVFELVCTFLMGPHTLLDSVPGQHGTYCAWAWTTELGVCSGAPVVGRWGTGPESTQLLVAPRNGNKLALVAVSACLACRLPEALGAVLGKIYVSRPPGHQNKIMDLISRNVISKA